MKTDRLLENMKKKSSLQEDCENMQDAMKTYNVRVSEIRVTFFNLYFIHAIHSAWKEVKSKIEKK